MRARLLPEEWYVFTIMRLTRHVKPGGVVRRTPLKLMSSCTGSFAEAGVLQASYCLSVDVECRLELLQLPFSYWEDKVLA